MKMEEGATVSALETDVYFQLNNSSDDELPSLQFLRFSDNGWLHEVVNVYSNGECEHKLADRLPLSVEPIEISELEEEWDGGKMFRSTVSAFNSMKALVLRSNPQQ